MQRIHLKQHSRGIHIYHLAVRDEGGQALSTKYSINVVVPSNKKLSGKLVSSSGTTANVEEEVTLTADLCRRIWEGRIPIYGKNIMAWRRR